MIKLQESNGVWHWVGLSILLSDVNYPSTRRHNLTSLVFVTSLLLYSIRGRDPRLSLIGSLISIIKSMLKRQVIGGPGARDLMAFSGQSLNLLHFRNHTVKLFSGTWWLLPAYRNYPNYSIGMTFSKSQLTS